MVLFKKNEKKLEVIQMIASVIPWAFQEQNISWEERLLHKFEKSVLKINPNEAKQQISEVIRKYGKFSNRKQFEEFLSELETKIFRPKWSLFWKLFWKLFIPFLTIFIGSLLASLVKVK